MKEGHYELLTRRDNLKTREGPVVLLFYSSVFTEGEFSHGKVILGRGDLVCANRVEGNGKGDDTPLYHLLQAVNLALGVEPTIISFNSKSLATGVHAPAQVRIKVRIEGRTYKGAAVNRDSLRAGVEAYLSAINRSLNGVH